MIYNHNAPEPVKKAASIWNEHMEKLSQLFKSILEANNNPGYPNKNFAFHQLFLFNNETSPMNTDPESKKDIEVKDTMIKALPKNFLKNLEVWRNKTETIYAELFIAQKEILFPRHVTEHPWASWMKDILKPALLTIIAIFFIHLIKYIMEK